MQHMAPCDAAYGALRCSIWHLQAETPVKKG